MLTFKNIDYYSPIEASKKFKISLSTIYYWIRRNELENCLLDLTKFGKEKEIDPKELRASLYINKKSLIEKAKFLNYTPVENYSIKGGK